MRDVVFHMMMGDIYTQVRCHNLSTFIVSRIISLIDPLKMSEVSGVPITDLGPELKVYLEIWPLFQFVSCCALIMRIFGLGGIHTRYLSFGEDNSRYSPL
jgi:hypothetical protein